MQRNPESAAVEAVAWYTDDHLSDRSATTWDPETAARWEAKGWKVWMLYKGSDVMALQARHEVALDALRGEVAAAERRVAELEAAISGVVLAFEQLGEAKGIVAERSARRTCEATMVVMKKAITKESP